MSYLDRNTGFEMTSIKAALKLQLKSIVTRFDDYNRRRLVDRYLDKLEDKFIDEAVEILARTLASEFRVSVSEGREEVFDLYLNDIRLMILPVIRKIKTVLVKINKDNVTIYLVDENEHVREYAEILYNRYRR